MEGFILDYNSLSKEQLIEIVQKLHRDKKYGLIWEKKTENIDQLLGSNYPVLTNIPEKDIITDVDNDNTHLIIEGDNLHSLMLLNITHKEAVDVIYIDPPYNKGNNDFVYNDNYVEKEDSWKHSKWASFMERRLKLARNVLKDTGIIFVSIDDDEFAQLKLIMDSVFNENNFITCLPWKGKGGGADNKFFMLTHEFIMVYAKNRDKCVVGLKEKEDRSSYNKYDPVLNRKYRTQLLRKWGSESNREDRKYMFYPILYNPTNETLSLPPDEEIERLYDRETDTFNDDYLQQLKENYEAQGYIFVLPIKDDGSYGRWRWDKSNIIPAWENREIEIVEVNGEWIAYEKIFEPLEGEVDLGKFDTWLDDVGNTANGTTELRKIVKDSDFSHPKPPSLIKRLIKMGTDKKDAVILDFFAGSGTTGQAVLELNEEDGGNRRFILCTNNELSRKTANQLRRAGIEEGSPEWEKHGIFQKTLYPRIYNLIKGYQFEGKDETILFEADVKNITQLKKVHHYFEQIENIKDENRGKYDKIQLKFEKNKLQLIGIKNINGYMEGYGGNLKCFKTDLVPKIKNMDQMKVIIAQKIYDLLCIKENCFNLIVDKPYYRIYKQGHRALGIYSYFQNNYIDEFKAAIKELNDIDITIYSFSFTDSIDLDLFSDIPNANVKPIPTKILEILNDLNRKRV